jgi:hypothetical protein
MARSANALDMKSIAFLLLLSCSPTFADDSAIRQAYWDYLGRPASNGEVQGWSRHSDAVAQIKDSTEAREHRDQSLYESEPARTSRNDYFRTYAFWAQDGRLLRGSCPVKHLTNYWNGKLPSRAICGSSVRSVSLAEFGVEFKDADTVSFLAGLTDPTKWVLVIESDYGNSWVDGYIIGGKQEPWIAGSPKVFPKAVNEHFESLAWKNGRADFIELARKFPVNTSLYSHWRTLYDTKVDASGKIYLVPVQERGTVLHRPQSPERIRDASLSRHDLALGCGIYGAGWHLPSYDEFSAHRSNMARYSAMPFHEDDEIWVSDTTTGSYKTPGHTDPLGLGMWGSRTVKYTKGYIAWYGDKSWYHDKTASRVLEGKHHVLCVCHGGGC